MMETSNQTFWPKVFTCPAWGTQPAGGVPCRAAGERSPRDKSRTKALRTPSSALGIWQEWFLLPSPGAARPGWHLPGEAAWAQGSHCSTRTTKQSCFLGGKAEGDQPHTSWGGGVSLTRACEWENHLASQLLLPLLWLLAPAVPWVPLGSCAGLRGTGEPREQRLPPSWSDGPCLTSVWLCPKDLAPWVS